MFCMNCGKELPNGAKFCSECGTPVEGKRTENVQAEPDNCDIQGIIYMLQGVRDVLQECERYIQIANDYKAMSPIGMIAGGHGLIGNVIVGISASRRGAKESMKKYREDVEQYGIAQAEKNKWERNINETIDFVSGKSIRGNYEKAQLVLQQNWDIVNQIPSEYWSTEYVDYMIRMFEQKRAKTLPDAYSLLDEKIHRDKVENNSAQILREIRNTLIY